MFKLVCDLGFVIYEFSSLRRRFRCCEHFSDVQMTLTQRKSLNIMINMSIWSLNRPVRYQFKP